MQTMNPPLRFSLNATESPTYYNLTRYLLAQDWCLVAKQEADFSDDNFQFNLKAALQLEYKHLLAQLVAKNCPELMPTTYCINDQNWPAVLNQLASDSYLKSDKIVNKINNLAWILKPSLLNNGQEIKIFEKLTDIELHFLNSNRLGGEHVLQRYLSNPHLLRDDRKYSIRMFVIATNYDGCFLYPDGYYNVALHRYLSNDFSDLRSHLTNEHLQSHEANVLQIPTNRFAEFVSLYPQIKTSLTRLLKGWEEAFPDAFITDNPKTLAIFGVDFLVDATGRLWLLEANHGPCFPLSEDHPLHNYLYDKFWKAFIKEFVLPIALKQSKKTIIYQYLTRLTRGKNLAEND